MDSSGRAAQGGNPALIEASSVLLLRDGAQGLETFVVVRHRKSTSFAGMLVFPGGQVDPEDADPVLHGRCDLEAEKAAAHLAAFPSPERALAQYVAAVRELFEEAGVLLARRRGDWIDGARDGCDLAALRAALHAGQSDLLALCREADLVLAPSALSFFAHWVTPEAAPMRFDTRFFVAALPPGQEASCDGRETSAGEWLAPAEALERYRRGEAQLVPPTFVLLSELARLRDVGAAHALAAARPVTRVLPRWFSDEGGPAFLYPGDVAYDGGDPERPGPRRRLVTRAGTFHEIVEG